MSSANAVLAGPVAPEAPRQAPLNGRNRIAIFVADDVSAAALRTGLEDTIQTVDVKRGNIYDAIRLLENDTDLHSVVTDQAVSPPCWRWRTWPRFARRTCRWR